MKGARRAGEMRGGENSTMGLPYLSFCEAKAVGELLPLSSDNVMVFLERVFEPQELRGGKSCPDSFGLSGQCVVQKKALGTRFIA